MSFCSFKKLSILSIIVVTSIFLNVSVYADEMSDLQADLDALSAKIDDLDREIGEYNTKISQTQGEAKTLKTALAKLELNRALLVKEIDKTKLKIKQTVHNIGITQGKITVTESILTKNKKALAETLRSIIYLDTNVPLFIQVLKPGSHLSDVIDTIKRNTDTSKAINEKVRALSLTKKELNDQKENFEYNKKTLERLTSTLSDKKILVEQTTKDKSNLLAQTKNKESEYQKLLADRLEKKNALEAEMLGVEDKIKIVVDLSKLPKYGKGVLKYPVGNVKITQFFGNTPFASKNPQVYNGSGHNGVDFGVNIGTPIMSAATGTVLGTGNTDTSCNGVSYGKWVLIRHSNGLSTLYAHLSVIQVSAGQIVSSGQKIGLSGNTGYTTGPHLHFTVYASDAVHISRPTEYKSKICGTYMILPLAPREGYLNPLSYL